ncbi:hypothetical protein [Sphingobium psychrophilum]|nr:hypothetical protein [Sphingobium psychrophilum]
MIRLLPLLLLTGCATIQSYATCDNAQRAIIRAQQAVERVCPIAR